MTLWLIKVELILLQVCICVAAIAAAGSDRSAEGGLNDIDGPPALDSRSGVPSLARRRVFISPQQLAIFSPLYAWARRDRHRLIYRRSQQGIGIVLRTPRHVQFWRAGLSGRTALRSCRRCARTPRLQPSPSCGARRASPSWLSATLLVTCCLRPCLALSWLSGPQVRCPMMHGRQISRAHRQLETCGGVLASPDVLPT